MRRPARKESDYENGPVTPMMTGDVIPAGTGIDGISWNVLGKTYVPKAHAESSLSWHATFPPGSFVPPHIHPTQDKFVYLLEGRLDVELDGKETFADPGETVRLPRGLPHGFCNRSEHAAKCFTWVAPARRLYDLFWALHNLGPNPDPARVVAVAAQHEVDFLPTLESA